MKKIVLVFAAIVLCGLILKAQLKRNHDSADRRDLISRLILNPDIKYNYPQGLKSADVYQKLDSAVRPNMYKDYYIYDNERRNIQHISAEWQNQQWVNSEKEEYFYDKNGNISSVTGYTWNASASQWINNLKGELTYSNNLISSLIFFEWINNQWINSYKCEYTYNLNNNCTSEYWYDWDAITTQWNNSEKSDYMYDNYGKRIQKIEWYYKMPYSVTTKYSYFYDTNGNMTLFTLYDWDYSTNTWLLSYKGEFTYDIKNRPILTIHSLPVGVDQWINARKIVYTYSNVVSPNNLILPYIREYYYDEFVDITAASFTMRRWDESTNDWYITYTIDKYFSDFNLNSYQLTVSTNALNIEAPANSTNTFDITSNLNWTAAINESWLTISNETGTGNRTITLTATANPTTTSRTSTVTVSATGVPSQTIMVTQPALSMQVTVFLEGAYVDSGLMNTALKAGALIPLSQPYNVSPWNYAGTETVASVPAGVVDWVLVELRQATAPAEALPGTTTLPGWPKACFLKSDGSIVGLGGTTLPVLGNPTISGNLYVIIRHRNHVAIMSAVGMTLTGSNYVYNFTDAISKAHGGSAGYRQIMPGVFGMVSGDPDADGEISVLDFSEWATNFGKTGIYIRSDIDEDGEVSVLDYSKWATNFGVGNIPPLKLKKLSIWESVRQYKSQVPDVEKER